MQRTLLVSAFVLVVGISSFIGGLSAQSRWFKDVPDDHWAKDAITFVADKGLMKGMTWDTFAPDEPVTRAQLAMVLYRQSQPSLPPPPSTPEEPDYEAATPDDDPVQGKTTARVTLIQFLDYQCPFCKRHFDDTLPLIRKNYIDTGKVKFVVRDFPLTFHVNAYAAAEASECADEQGKFWPMHDLLYEEQSLWMDAPDPTEVFAAFADEIGLDESEFLACIESGDMADEVSDDLEDGSASGISGTPGFWILGPNGQAKQISGAYPYETFNDAFEEMLD